jgi:hypothetical protein
MLVASVLILLTGITLMAGLDHEARWKDVSAQLLTVLSSVVLPVVTLVIGDDFGSDTRDQGGRWPPRGRVTQGAAGGLAASRS